MDGQYFLNSIFRRDAEELKMNVINVIRGQSILDERPWVQTYITPEKPTEIYISRPNEVWDSYYIDNGIGEPFYMLDGSPIWRPFCKKADSDWVKLLTKDGDEIEEIRYPDLPIWRKKMYAIAKRNWWGRTMELLAPTLKGEYLIDKIRRVADGPQQIALVLVKERHFFENEPEKIILYKPRKCCRYFNDYLAIVDELSLLVREKEIK
ncbi:MAG: hypothetical protein WC711_04350 [Candidatus Staskawiczbacteria bacterium]|jgi:hypothetical protein